MAGIFENLKTQIEQNRPFAETEHQIGINTMLYVQGMIDFSCTSGLITTEQHHMLIHHLHDTFKGYQVVS